MALYGLGSLVHGDVAAGPWFRMLLGIPVSPLGAAATSKASWGIAAFFWCFGLAPWLLAALAIWRHDVRRWRWLCYAFIPLWWLGLALMGGTA